MRFPNRFRNQILNPPAPTSNPAASQNWLFSSTYADLATAITAIGATEATLVINEAESLTDNVTTPSTLTILFSPQADVTISSSKTWTISGDVIAPRNQQIFKGSGVVTFDSVIPETLHPEWWGAVGDGSTDDLSAFDAMVAAIPDTKSARIGLAVGKNYKLSDTWHIDAKVSVEGEGGDNWNNISTITMAANKTGIVAHHAQTLDGANTRDGLFSQFKNFALIGSASGTTHTVNISGLTLTRTAGDSFSDTAGYHDGNTVTINGFTYLLNTTSDGDTVTVYKPRIYGRVVLGSTSISIGDYNAWPTNNAWDGQDIDIDGTTYTISSTTASTMTLSAPFAGTTNETSGGFTFATTDVNTSTETITKVAHGLTTGDAIQFTNVSTPPAPFVVGTAYYAIKVDNDSFKLATSRANAVGGTPIDITDQGTGTHTVVNPSFLGTMEVQSLATSSANAARFNLFHGLDLRAAARVEGMKIWSFAGNGISMDSALTPGISGTTPNCNNSYIARNSTYYNFGNGIYTKGINSNQSCLINNDSTNNYGAGIYEASFLGNNYFSNHTSFNYYGATYGRGSVNVSCFVGEYSEGGQPSEYYDQYMLVIGGNHAALIDSASGGGLIQQAQGRFTVKDLYADTSDASTETAAILLGEGQPNTILGLGAGEESANISGGGTTSNITTYAYQLGYNQLATGWYNLYYGGNYSTDQGAGIIAFSGSNASAGGGKLAFPNGFRFGVADPTISKILKGTLTVDPASISGNTVATQTFTLTGAATGDTVILNPPTAGLTAGLLVAQTFISASDTVSVVFHNTTGSPIDEASASWGYTLIR